MRRSLTATIALATSLGLAACGGGRERNRKPKEDKPAKVENNGTNATPTPQPGAKKNEIVVHLESDPPHFNRLIKPDLWIYRIVGNQVTETLIREDPYSYEVTPVLAKELPTISADGLTYTFKLREGVKWHDGQPFTAKDVAFTFDKVFDTNANTAAVRADYEPFLDEAKGRYKAVDDFTFEIYLKKKSAFMMVALSDLNIIPKHVFETGDFNTHPANNKPVGTGPYIFDGWEKGKEVTLTKNPNYWGEPAKLDRIIYRQITDSTVAFGATRSGEIDMMGRLRTEQLSQIDDTVRAEFEHQNYYPAVYGFMLFNLERPVFKDKAVRKAISMLVDRETVARDLEKGRYRLIESPYIYGAKNYNTSLTPIKYDPEAAIKILEDAGWKDSDNDGVREKGGVKLSFTFSLTAGSSGLEKEMTLVQNDFKKAGIEMNLTKMEWSIFSEKLDKHDFDLVSFLQQSSSPQNDFYQLFHSSQSAAGGSNYGSYSNPEVDKLLEEIRVELDPEKRLPMELRLQEILHDDLPMFFKYGPQTDYIIRKGYASTDPSVTQWFQLRKFAIAQAP